MKVDDFVSDFKAVAILKFCLVDVESGGNFAVIFLCFRGSSMSLDVDCELWSLPPVIIIII